MMPAKAKAFDFETYVVQSLESVQKKLDGLNVAYVPRAELDLRFAEIDKTLSTVSQSILNLTTTTTLLKEKDDLQQGSIDASRRIQNTAWTVIGLLLTGLFIYVTWRVGMK